MDISSLIFSFIGTLVALAVTKTIERWLSRSAEQAETARDVIVALAGLLPSLEVPMRDLVKPADITDKASLRRVPSGFNVGYIPMAIDKILPAFRAPEVHRLVLRLFNRSELFKKASDDNRTAYFWLLDSKEPWDCPATAERVETIADARRRMLAYVSEMTRYGYELLERLFPLASSPHAWPSRGPGIEFLARIKHEFGLDAEEARLRRAYFAVGFANQADVRPYDPSQSHGLHVWAVDAGDLVGLQNVCLFIELVFPAQGAATTIWVRPNEEVALPGASRIEAVQPYCEESGIAWRGQQRNVGKILGRNFRASPSGFSLPDEVVVELRSRRVALGRVTA